MRSPTRSAKPILEKWKGDSKGSVGVQLGPIVSPTALKNYPHRICIGYYRRAHCLSGGEILFGSAPVVPGHVITLIMFFSREMGKGYKIYLRTK